MERCVLSGQYFTYIYFDTFSATHFILDTIPELINKQPFLNILGEVELVVEASR
jgi:hypothetical protein